MKQFGRKLSEKIKASKTIEKQGLQIKKTVVPQKSSTATTSQQQTTSQRPALGSRETGRPLLASSRRTGRARRITQDRPKNSQGTSADDQPDQDFELQQTACPNTTVTQVHAGRLQAY